MRFYVDEDLPDTVASIGRALGLDVVSTREMGNGGRPDEWQLRYAIEHRRCIVTKNAPDFLGLSNRYPDGEFHCEILVVSRSLPREDGPRIARALAHYARLHPEDVIHHTDWLHPAPLEG